MPRKRSICASASLCKVSSPDAGRPVVHAVSNALRAGVMACLLSLPQTCFSAPPPKSTQHAASKPATLTLSPIHIDDVHENDATVKGVSPVPNVALTVKLNGLAGISSANANASGDFAIALPGPAQAGNFVEVSGTAPNGAALYGKGTVSAGGAAASGSGTKPASLSKPSITAAHDGDSSITVTWNSADASQAGLNVHVKVTDSSHPSNAWEGDCAPDAKSGSCTVTPKSVPLTSGQVIVAYETLASGGPASPGPSVSITVAAAQGLMTPAVAAQEGSPVVFLTPDSHDAGRGGLRIHAQLVDEQGANVGNEQSCAPGSAGSKCQVLLDKAPGAASKIRAWEQAGDARGPDVVADVTQVQALSKPTIKTPHQGETSVTVTLNSADVSAVKPPARLKIKVWIGGGSESGAQCTCQPDDSTNSCQVPLPALGRGRGPRSLVEGQVINAEEVLAGESRRPGDQIAVATVVNDALGAPAISIVTENDTTVTVKLNAADLAKWPGKLSVAADVYDGDSPVAGQSNSCSPADNADNCKLTFSALAAGQAVRAREVPNASANGTPSEPGPESVAYVQELGFNWGRVRAYFSAGAVLSRNTVSSANSTTPASLSQTNFTSPEAFAAFDMDFNWYSSQHCLASAYLSRSVRLATLVEAVAQCHPALGHDGNDKGGGLKAPPAVEKALRQEHSVRDASLLSLISRLYAKPESLPARLKAAVEDLRTCQEEDGQNVRDCTEAVLTELSSLDLTREETWQILEALGGFEQGRQSGFLVNSYFDTRLTQTAGSNGFALAASPNSVHIETGLYAPFYFPWSRWSFHHRPYAAFVAPIGKLGFDSLRGSATDQLLQLPATPTGGSCPSPTNTPGQQNFCNATQALSKDIYRMMVIGGRFGFMSLAPKPNRAPEMISYIDFTYGRFDNYFVEKYKDTSGAVRFPLRFDMTGLLKIPTMPLYTGFDLNKGAGPDNLTLFVGLRSDLSSLLSKLIPTTSSK